MDEVRGRANGRVGRRVWVALLGPLAVLTALASVAAACVTHTAAGGNHHDVVATDCDNPGCTSTPDLIGNGGGGTIPDPFGVGFDADRGSTVVSTVQLAMAVGPNCLPGGLVCTTLAPGQTAMYDIRSAPNLTQCSNNTGTTVVSSGNIGRNFTAAWTVPTTTGNYTACVALPSTVPAIDETYVHYTVF